MLQRTLSIIKPDAVARGLQGEILAMIQASGLRIAAMKMLRLTEAQAGAFYEVHRERPFYGDLVRYMTSGPVVCSVLEGEDAVAAYRALMGSTDPAKAAEGTIRRKYAQSVQANAVHGSDAPETAAREIAFFFSQTEIVG
ncbi:nucleoside-diphosphate kinase [uncultured Mailhella sp.]|uniref:nucleoside-diphosphate kinase n=1 Tax=uncultured Mailhella sp. TaxID=1981031 RepID=UPI0026227714|nr:nucleoside-diphosphate kinase [uncultured Mailhella sp.]